MTPLELKTEINSGPLKSELAPFMTAGDVLSVARVLNRRDIASKKRALMTDLVNYLSDQGILANIADAAADATNTAHAAARKVVATLRLSTELGVTSINMTRPGNEALIANLVSAGLMTVGQAAGVKALADTLYSRAEVVWGEGTSVSPSDVAESRRA